MDSKSLTQDVGASRASEAHTSVTSWPTHPSAISRALGLLLGSVLLIAICAALLAPPLLALVGGVWAAVTEVRTIAAIWALARHQDYSAVVAHLATLDTASRVAFLGVSFFALLFALMLLMAGLLGRRWARLFIAPGLVFTTPALVCYIVGWLWLTPVAARHGVSSLAQTSLAAYMLLDVVVLATALCDMRPTLRRARRVARLGKHTRPSLPAVRVAANGASAGDPTLLPMASADLLADVDDAGPRAYPPPRFALQAPITRPMAAIRIEDVAPTLPGADVDAERDEFAISAEAETWRIFSGEWAAWGANDMALRQEVTLPALGWPTAEDDDTPPPALRNAAPQPSASQQASRNQSNDALSALSENPGDASDTPSDTPSDIAMPVVASVAAVTAPPATHAAPASVDEATPALAGAAQADIPAPIAPSAPEPLTDTAQFGALVAIPDVQELADAPLPPDAPLALALVE